VLRDLLIRAARRPLADWLRGYAGVAVAGVVYVLLRRHALGEFVGTAPSIAPIRRSLSRSSPPSAPTSASCCGRGRSTPTSTNWR
jgi:hypothetical protein